MVFLDGLKIVLSIWKSLAFTFNIYIYTYQK